MAGIERPKEIVGHCSIAQLYERLFRPVEDELRAIYDDFANDLNRANVGPDKFKISDPDIYAVEHEVTFWIDLQWIYDDQEMWRRLSGKIRRASDVGYEIHDGHPRINLFSRVTASFFKQFGWKPAVASWICENCDQTSGVAVDMIKEYGSYVVSLELFRESGLCGCVKRRLAKLYTLFYGENLPSRQ